MRLHDLREPATDSSPQGIPSGASRQPQVFPGKRAGNRHARDCHHLNLCSRPSKRGCVLSDKRSERRLPLVGIQVGDDQYAQMSAASDWPAGWQVSLRDPCDTSPRPALLYRHVIARVPC